MKFDSIHKKNKRRSANINIILFLLYKNIINNNKIINLIINLIVMSIHIFLVKIGICKNWKFNNQLKLIVQKVFFLKKLSNKNVLVTLLDSPSSSVLFVIIALYNAIFLIFDELDITVST